MKSDLRKIYNSFSRKGLQAAFGCIQEVKKMDSDKGRDVRLTSDKKDLLIKSSKRKDRKGNVYYFVEDVQGDSKIGKNFAASICKALD